MRLAAQADTVAVYDSPDRQWCKGYRIPLGPPGHLTDLG